MKMKVDGKYPFYECRSLEFETTWKLSEEKAYDRYDNETVTIPNKQIQWESKYLMDSSYRHSDPLKVQLTKGKHSIELSVDEGNFLLEISHWKHLHLLKSIRGLQIKRMLMNLSLFRVKIIPQQTVHQSMVYAEYDTSVEPYRLRIRF